MNRRKILISGVAGLSLMLMACSSEASGNSDTDNVAAAAPTAASVSTVVSTQTAVSTETVAATENATTDKGLTATAPFAVTVTSPVPSNTADTATQPEIDPGIGNGDPSSSGGPLGSCSEVMFIDDSYNHAVNGHEFIRICNQEDAEGTIALQYIFDGVVQDEEFLNYQYAQSYQLKCDPSGTSPVCLVEVEDSSGKSFYGSLYALFPDGQFHPLSADSLSSTVEMTMVEIPTTDPTDLSLMLVAGLKFNDLGTSEADAPVGYQTWALSPDMATLTGCTPAYSPNYPELPTEPVTGPCDSSAEVINN